MEREIRNLSGCLSNVVETVPWRGGRVQCSRQWFQKKRMNRFTKSLCALGAAAMLFSTAVFPAAAVTGSFRFNMPKSAGIVMNTYGYVQKDYDGDPNFYVHPTGGTWAPLNHLTYVYAINDRGQNCSTSKQLVGNRNHVFAYNSASIPVGGQYMNIKLQEAHTLSEGYTMTGVWTP